MDEKNKLESFSITYKEKKGNKFALSVECLDVVEDEELSICVKKFCVMSTVEEQLKYFKHLSQLYLVKTCDGKNLCGNFIKFAVNIFILTHPKNPLKNAVAQILSRAVHLKNIILQVLSEYLSSRILSVDCDLKLDNEVEKLKLFDETIGTLAIAMNFQLGQEAVAVHFTRTLVFLYHCFNDYFKGLETERAPSLREVLHQYVHNAVRTFVSLHQYCNPDKVLNCKETSDKFAEERRHTIVPLEKSLRNILCNLLVVEDLPLDVGNTCALALVTFVSRENKKLWQELLHIAVSGNNSANEFPRLSVPTVTTCINLCLGLLGGLSVADLVFPLLEKSVRCSPLSMILSVLLDLAQRKPCKPTLELGSSRGIQKVLCIIESVVTDNCVLNNMKAMCVSDHQTALEISYSCDVDGNSKNEEIKFVTCELFINKSTDLLHVLFSQTEHFMDSVRHVARGSLQMYARVACALETKGENRPSIEFVKTLCSLSPFRRARYIALSAVASGGPKDFAVRLLVAAGLMPTDFVKIIVSRDSSLRPHAASAFEALMNADSPITNTSTELLQVWLRHWVEPILHALSSSVYLPSHSILETLLAKAVKRYPSGIVKLVMEMFQNDLKTDVCTAPGNLCALLVCLRAARIHGLFDSEVDTDILWKETLSFDILLNGAIHSSDEVKLGVLALIVDTHRSTEPPSAGELHVVRTVLEHTANSQVASTRQQCTALFKRLLSRLRNSATPAACRRQNNRQKVTELRVSFLDWTVEFSIENLFPGANFGRRCFSLQMLKLLVEELRNDVPSQLWLPKNGSVLLEMLKDSYEENKCVALFVLKHFPTSALKFNDANFVYSLLCACEELAKSVRPPSSSTAAYILLLISSFPSETEVLSAVSKIELRFNLETVLISSQNNGHYGLHCRILLIYLRILEQQVSLAQNNLIAAVCTGPMYGVLLCIRLLLQDVDLCLVANTNWCSLIDCIIKCCYKATAVVEPIVNSSSPEGYIPMDAQRISDLLEESGNDLDDQQHCDVTAQQVLLCAWRTIKESSLVMGWLAKQAPLNQSGGFTTGGLLDAQQLLVMGQHFTRLLSEIKHRGAFEQVYVGFCQLCSRIWSLGDSAVEKNGSLVIHELPIKWLDELLNLVLSAEGDNSARLCSTRRSAGVPFLVQALLATEPSAVECSPIFQRCMHRLFDMAEGQSSSDTRTHALNILRAIFRCADLREPSVSYIARGVMVAVYCCRAETWSERNAATLLFSTLLVRLFGVGRSGSRLRRTTGRVFFHQYPSLYDFLLHEISSLSKGMTFNSSYSMNQFPSLLLLSCLHPNSLEGADSNLQLSRFVPLVSAYAESNSEFTRKLAAQALAPIVSAGDWSELVDKLLSTASSPNTSLNLRHGIVLQVVSLLQTFSHQLAIDENLQKQSIKWLNSNQSLLLISSSNYPCFLTAEAYIQVVQILINIFLSTAQSICDTICPENKKANDTLKSKASNMLVCGTPMFEHSCWSTIHRIITDEMKWLKESKISRVEPGLCLYQIHACQLLLTLTNILAPENIIPFINEMLLSQIAVIVLTTLNFVLNSLGHCSIRCPLEGDLEDIKNEQKPLDFPELASALVTSDSIAKSIASLFFMQKETLLPDSRRVVFQLLPNLPLLIKHIGIILAKSLSKETRAIETTTCEEEKCGELVLQWLLQELRNDSQCAGPSVIALLGAFLLSSIEVNQISKADFSLTSSSLQHVCSILQSTSSSECSLALRLSVAQVMSSKGMSLLLLNPHKSGLGSLSLCYLWTTAVMLLDDDSHEVRQQACCLVLHMPSSNGMPVSERKARQIFVSEFVQCMTSYDHLCVAVTLTSWILQQVNLEDVNMTEEQLFDETETNCYGESVPLSCIASESLKNLIETFPSLSKTPLEMCLCDWIANQCWNTSFSNENIQNIPTLKKRNIIQSEWSTLSELASSMEKYFSGLGATFVKADEYPPQVYSFLNPALTYTSGVSQRLTLLQKALHLP